jgi:hypothetical protein
LRTSSAKSPKNALVNTFKENKNKSNEKVRQLGKHSLEKFYTYVLVLNLNIVIGVGNDSIRLFRRSHYLFCWLIG